jgi:hypothetical protein
MSESPYADAILDYLADQEPHTIAEIHAAIGASDGGRDHATTAKLNDNPVAGKRSSETHQPP